MQNTPETSVRNDRWLKPALMVSLALNLAFVGVIAGAALRFESSPRVGGGPPTPGSFGRAYMMALPKEDRRAILGTLRASHNEALPDRAARRQMFTTVVRALETTPFDQAGLEAAVSRQAKASIAVQRAAQRAWVAHVSEMNDAERREYAQAVQAYLKDRRPDKNRADERK